MPILWKAIQRKNPQRPTDPAKFYAQDVTRSYVKKEESVELIAEQMGVSKAVAQGFVEAQAIVIARCLCHSDSYELYNLGVLSASATSEGTATPEELGKVKKDRSVNFRIASELKSALDDTGDQFTGEVTNLPPTP